jgi:Protein of unknown function (DUF2752)
MTETSLKPLDLAMTMVFVLIPLTFLLLPTDFFDKGEAVCLSVRLLGLECPGCGITRATMHLIHLDVNGAIFYNILSFATTPLIFWLWWTWFKEPVAKVYKKIVR